MSNNSEQPIKKVKKLSRREIRNQNTKLLKQLKQKKDGELDQILNNEHEKAFEKINCLSSEKNTSSPSHPKIIK